MQEVGLAKGKDANDDELEIPETIEDSDDEGKADDIDMGLDLLAADT